VIGLSGAIGVHASLTMDNKILYQERPHVFKNQSANANPQYYLVPNPYLTVRISRPFPGLEVLVPGVVVESAHMGACQRQRGLNRMNRRTTYLVHFRSYALEPAGPVAQSVRTAVHIASPCLH
jgi:hypothetical protein